MVAAPPTVDAVVARVRAYVISYPDGKTKLAKRCGVAINSLARVEGPGWRPSIKTLRKIESHIPKSFSPRPQR